MISSTCSSSDVACRKQHRSIFLCIRRLRSPHQHDAALFFRDPDDFPVVVIVMVEHVESEHAQLMGKTTEVGVRDEAVYPQRAGRELRQQRHVERTECG